MDEEKTTLQKIIGQKVKQMRDAIEQAISEGAKVEHSKFITNGYFIDGIFVQKEPVDNISICLHMKSEMIAAACTPSKKDLEKMAEQKRVELEEIEKQINAKQ